MNRSVRIGAYVVLGLVLLGCAFGLFRSLKQPFPASPSVSTNAATVAATNSEALQTTSAAAGGARWMKYFAGLLGVGIVLAILAAYDISHLVAQRAERFIFNDDLEGVRDPEYEEAEKAWANSDYLGAIQRMRDYLKRHPFEQYVALRIAEIYEKDLANYLAAALEYEEVLKKKLPPERWGWAAIHLANLYSGKLGKSTEAVALLQRIVNEYGQTAAAKKARERLGISETPPEQPDENLAEETKPSNLPPGFRPK